MKRIILLWLLPAIIIFETLTIPLNITGADLKHPVLNRLGELYIEETGNTEPPDLIVNFPLLPLRAQFPYQQTIHEIPMLNGHISNPPPGALDAFFNFNWHRENLKLLEIDLVLFHPWAAKTSLGEKFHIPEDARNIDPEWQGQDVEPLVFLRDVMEYRIIYEDEKLIVMVP